MINRRDVHASFSKTYAYKKVTKPLLERKRRARINRCLEELKNLMAKALVVEEQNVSKLEKADVLELTVRHLHRLRRNASSEEEAFRFQAGFSQCAIEAYNFLLNLPGVDAHLSQQLVKHLQSVVGPLSIQVPNFRLLLSPPASPSSPPSSRHSPDFPSPRGGLLMVASQEKTLEEPSRRIERKSFLDPRTADEFVDRMWRPWKTMQ